MNIEEAIKYLKEMAFQDYSGTPYEIAIEALAKQIPREPIGDLGSVPHYRCPSCNSAIVVYENGNKYPYCQWCGQAIDWSDSDD